MILPGFYEGTGMPDPGWWEALWPDPAWVLDQAGLQPGMAVTDLCAGDGWFTLQIARIARKAYAIDLDAKLLESSRIRLSDAGIHNCQFIEGDAFDITRLVPEPVDYVFLANAFHGVPDRPRLSKAVRDGLKSGGLFGIVSWHARRREETTVLGKPRGPATELRMTPETTIQEVEPSGFKLVKVLDVSPHHYATVFQRQ